MFLVIKGNRLEAIQALNSHDIPVLSDGKEYNSANEFHTNCHISQREKVKAWFEESSSVPYKSGDLLFYSETEFAVLI